MMAQMRMRMDMRFVFMPMGVYVQEIVCLKQLNILQYDIRLAGLNYFPVMAKNIHEIGYLLDNMQVVGGGNNCFPRSIGLN